MYYSRTHCLNFANIIGCLLERRTNLQATEAALNNIHYTKYDMNRVYTLPSLPWLNNDIRVYFNIRDILRTTYSIIPNQFGGTRRSLYYMRYILTLRNYT